MKHPAAVPLLAVAAVLTFWFNRIGERVPDASVDAYKDYFAAWGGRVNGATGRRFLTAGACLVVAWLTRALAAARDRRASLPATSQDAAG